MHLCNYLNLPAQIKELRKEYFREVKARELSRKELWAVSPLRCKVCGETEGKIYCHHVDGNPKNTAIENLEWRCPSCHRGAHPSSFGTIKTSPNLEQSTV